MANLRWLMLIPIFAAFGSFDLASGQMSQWQDSSGTMGQTFDLGQGMGMWNDNKGNMGSYQDLGTMGTYQDQKGTTGQWMDVGPNLRTFQDNHGGHGQMQDLGNGFGTFQYQAPNGQTRHGAFQQFGGR